MTAVAEAGALRALPGSQFPLGATPAAGGTNFAVFSGVAGAVTLCLFDAQGRETRIPLEDYDAGVWHGFVPGVGPGQAYGYRVSGPYAPARGLRCNPAKLLLDPYARAISGEVAFGPEVLDYAADDPGAPSELDSAGHVPRSLVGGETFQWTDSDPVRRRYSDTVIYEVHVKGYTMRHPGVPAQLRGTYAGLGHEAAIASRYHQYSLTSSPWLPCAPVSPKARSLRIGSRPFHSASERHSRCSTSQNPASPSSPHR